MSNENFKAGDLVYCLDKDFKVHRLVKKVFFGRTKLVLEDDITGYYGSLTTKELYPIRPIKNRPNLPLFIEASMENYERLCGLYPDFEFENPQNFIEKLSKTT